MIDKRPTLLVIALALAAAAAAVWAQQSQSDPGHRDVDGDCWADRWPRAGAQEGTGSARICRWGEHPDRVPVCRAGAGAARNSRAGARRPQGRRYRHWNRACGARVQQSTATIPIVAVLSDHDPVASGLVDSLSRPGRNVTGVVSRQSELVGKRLELLKEALPKLSRVAVLWDSFSQRQFDELQQVARSLGIQLQSIQLRNPYDFKAAFRSAKQREAGAVVVLFSPVFYRERAQIATLALEAGLPTMNQEESWVTAGGFISYGATIADTFGRAAYFVDRLLKGAKAADLPVEQATGFKLTVNLKTAKALRLSVPESIVLRADDVIR